MKYIAYRIATGEITSVRDADWSEEIKTQYAATHGFGTIAIAVTDSDFVIMANGAAVLDEDGHLQLVAPELATRKGLMHIANNALDDSHITDLLTERNARHNFRNARKHFERTDSDADKSDMEEACADFQEARHHATPAHYYKATLDAITGKIRLANETAAGEKIAARVKDFHAAYGESVSVPQRNAAVAALKTLYTGKTEAEFLSATNFETDQADALTEANKRITITASTNSRLFISEFRAGEDGVVAQVGETYDLLAGQSVSFDAGWARLEVTALNGETDNNGNAIFADPDTIGFDLTTLRYAIGSGEAQAARPTFAQAGSSKITITQAAE